MKIFVTGTAGFIGFHLAQLLLNEGFEVCGYDGMTDYYDVSLKKMRHKILQEHAHFTATEGMLEDTQRIERITDAFKPDVIVHLAGQAGVRYSLENPRAYVDSNIVGSFNVMEAAKRLNVKHLLMASTSSVYGANEEMPYTETDKADTPLTVYAATKKAAENLGHTYAHLWNLPITMFRSFTVYGPWGRPDMAYFKFTKAIDEGEPIDIYNNGMMYRDFTYIDDLVRGLRLLIDAVPQRPHKRNDIPTWDSLSPVAPYRIVNIGNSERVRLLDFIDAIEDALGKKAVRNYIDMQKGDVPATWANAKALKQLTGYEPNTHFRDGVERFVDWFSSYTKSQHLSAGARAGQ